VTLIPELAAAAVKTSLLACGWYAMRLRRDRLPGVLVCCYHGVRSVTWRGDERSFPHLHVAPATFEAHLRTFRTMCHPISLDDWRAAIAGIRRLPDRPVLVTFDDGYRSVFDIARPLLKRYRVPASIFACSTPIGRQHLFWFDALARARGESAVRSAKASADRNRLRADEPAASDDPLAPMTVDQLKQLADEGFEIGAHTATHAQLSGAEAAIQRDELTLCRDSLASWIGGPVRALAYPWGTPGVDYTPETVRIAADLGFDFAFTTRHGFATDSEPALERSRFMLLSEVGPAELAHRIAYAWR